MFTETLQSLIIESVGLGLVLSLVFSETLGLAAGGMVVPGYIALMIHDPGRLIGTILVALATYGAVKLLSSVAFIYGRRRIVFTILIGFVLGLVSRDLLVFDIAGMNIELHTIGLIIPGLIANWIERQGVISTLSMMIIAAVFIRLLLMILSGGDIGLGGAELL